MRICSVRGCDRPHRAKGYCKSHWQSFTSTGVAPTKPIAPYGQACSVDGCERKHLANGYCMLHRDRVRKHGDPLVVLPPNGGWSPKWETKTPSYRRAHGRVVALRGKASSWPCAKCGEVALDWTYDYADPEPLVDPASGCPYSADPAHYLPMCRRCHTRHDRENGRRNASRASSARVDHP